MGERYGELNIKVQLILFCNDYPMWVKVCGSLWLIVV